jgi:hypothetical protein
MREVSMRLSYFTHYALRITDHFCWQLNATIIQLLSPLLRIQIALEDDRSSDGVLGVSGAAGGQKLLGCKGA